MPGSAERSKSPFSVFLFLLSIIIITIIIYCDSIFSHYYFCAASPAQPRNRTFYGKRPSGADTGSTTPR